MQPSSVEPTASDVRDADESEIDALARLWYDAWQDAHAGILPVELARHRTMESFRSRLRTDLSAFRVAGPLNRPVGLCMTKGDELHQLFVASVARGTGVAAALTADAERRIAESGWDVAWLACAIGNERAARFYEKCGWRRIGVVTIDIAMTDGVLQLDVWRYEKAVVMAARSGRCSDAQTAGGDAA